MLNVFLFLLYSINFFHRDHLLQLIVIKMSHIRSRSLILYGDVSQQHETLAYFIDFSQGVLCEQLFHVKLHHLVVHVRYEVHLFVFFAHEGRLELLISSGQRYLIRAFAHAFQKHRAGVMLFQLVMVHQPRPGFKAVGFITRRRRLRLRFLCRAGWIFITTHHHHDVLFRPWYLSRVAFHAAPLFITTTIMTIDDDDIRIYLYF